MATTSTATDSGFSVAQTDHEHELEALTTVVDTVHALPEDRRKRVLDTATAMLGVKAPRAASPRKRS